MFRPVTMISVGVMGMAVVGGLMTVSLTPGQERAPLPPEITGQQPSAQPSAQKPGPDVSKWPVFAKQAYLRGQRSSEWLQRANGPDGRFVPGYVPALRVPLESVNFLHQAGAAFALGKAATYYGDAKAAAVARQAVLTLLVDTALEDPRQQPPILACTLPTGVVNRLGAAGALVQAICELPAPAYDVLDKAEQLCNFIRRAQRADGSMRCSEPDPEGKVAIDDLEAINKYPGEALYALMRSHQQKPAAWKLDVVRKALPYYQAHWRAHKNLAMVPRQTGAYAEAYLHCNDKALADFVFEMNDWLCSLQFTQLDARQPLWVGGFKTCVEGTPVLTAPQAEAAAYAESLVLAARVARQVGDVPRWDRYKAALERCLEFLGTLQYAEANTQHFTERFRPTILGALHGSGTDGTIRLEYAAQAVCGFVGYLTHVADRP